MLVVKMRVAALETLFATTFHVFQSPERSHVSALGDYSYDFEMFSLQLLLSM